METIKIEVATNPDGDGGVKYIYEFNVIHALWNAMEQWERDEYLRRKLWKRLQCEYKVIGEDQA